jgi:hypothetical protein
MALPDANTLELASEITVFDAHGEKISFGSIFEEQQTVVVFIRALDICMFSPLYNTNRGDQVTFSAA